MDLIEAKIAEIKNLNLIYIFTTDNIFRSGSDKYIGAKVVYDKDKLISLDYKNEHFEKFIKRILNRYNKEKNKRNIILLGDLTKKLVNDSLFDIEEKVFSQSYGILVNSKKNDVKAYEAYLKMCLKTILKSIKGYDYVNISSIDGFNNKYVVNYQVGNMKKQLFMLIFLEENGNLDFRITNIENSIVNINGSIEDNLSLINIKWRDSILKLDGLITYDSNEKIIEEKLYKDEHPIISRESVDTLLDEDDLIISFYMQLFNLDMLNNIMKIDDNCYLLSNNEIKEENKDNIFYNSKSCKISIFDELVVIKYIEKNGLSKYNDQIKVVLEENIDKITLKKINIDDKYYILIEKRSTTNKGINYNYSVLELNNDVNLCTPFEYEERHEIENELRSFNMTKQYIKKIKGGN